MSNATDWTFTIAQFLTADCSGSSENSKSKAFDVAKATIYADSGLTTLQSTFSVGTTAYVVVAGLEQNKGDSDAVWLLPSAATACGNTAGGDRPDSNATGGLPNPAGSFLQYPPNTTATGDVWNRVSNYDGGGPCPAFSSGNPGTWQLKLQRDPTHFVTLTVFDVTTCGDGVAGGSEQCDLGANNGQPGFCCSATCQFVSASTVCRAAAGTCDGAASVDDQIGPRDQLLHLG